MRLIMGKLFGFTLAFTFFASSVGSATPETDARNQVRTIMREQKTIGGYIQALEPLVDDSTLKFYQEKLRDHESLRYRITERSDVGFVLEIALDKKTSVLPFRIDSMKDGQITFQVNHKSLVHNAKDSAADLDKKILAALPQTAPKNSLIQKSLLIPQAHAVPPAAMIWVVSGGFVGVTVHAIYQGYVCRNYDIALARCENLKLSADELNFYAKFDQAWLNSPGKCPIAREKTQNCLRQRARDLGLTFRPPKELQEFFEQAPAKKSIR